MPPTTPTPHQPSREPPRAALFDVDGTLVDTNYLHTVSWWEAFRQHGHQVPTAEVHRAIGMSSDHLLDHLLGADRDRDRDDALRAAHGALYAQYWSRLAPLDGAAELLRACARRGLRVVLASSAHERELAVMRRALDADDAVCAATGADDVDAGKPAPDLVRQALEHADTEPEHAVFVGDTAWDVQAAGRAEVPCVAFLSGGWSRAELREAGAAEIYTGPAELLRRLDRSLLGAAASPAPAVSP